MRFANSVRYLSSFWSNAINFIFVSTSIVDRCSLHTQAIRVLCCSIAMFGKSIAWFDDWLVLNCDWFDMWLVCVNDLALPIITVNRINRCSSSPDVHLITRGLLLYSFVTNSQSKKRIFFSNHRQRIEHTTAALCIAQTITNQSNVPRYRHLSISWCFEWYKTKLNFVFFLSSSVSKLLAVL